MVDEINLTTKENKTGANSTKKSKPWWHGIFPKEKELEIIDAEALRNKFVQSQIEIKLNEEKQKRNEEVIKNEKDFNYIYKKVLREAEKGNCELLVWESLNMDNRINDYIIKQLSELGYKTEVFWQKKTKFQFKETIYKITW